MENSPISKSFTNPQSDYFVKGRACMSQHGNLSRLQPCHHILPGTGGEKELDTIPFIPYVSKKSFILFYFFEQPLNTKIWLVLC